jgi:uncharacterized membrane protein YqaE (UPF0057 family)
MSCQQVPSALRQRFDHLEPSKRHPYREMRSVKKNRKIKWFNLFSRSVMDFIRLAFSLLLPPVGVFLQVGLRPQFWINILLTLLGYVPGIIHAAWIIFRR